MPNAQPPIVPGQYGYPQTPSDAPRRSWWSRLSAGPKALLILGAAAIGVCLVPVMVIAAIGASVQSDQEPPSSPTRGVVAAPPTTSTPTTSAPVAAPPPTTPGPATTSRTTAPRTPTRTTTKSTTTPAQHCDPNYAWACVPIASDVDCAGGGGNGPAYVQGPVKVIGVDIYDLDRDGDGIGCDT